MRMRSVSSTSARVATFALVMGLVASCSSDPWVEIEAVTLPADLTEVRTAELGPASARLLADDDGCVRLVVRARGREQRSGDAACQVGAFDSAIRIQEPSVRFNDRPRQVRRCEGDCAGPPTDATLPAPIAYGRVGALVAAVCTDGPGGITIIRPSPGGYVLQAANIAHEPLLFLADGRWIGPDPTSVSKARIERCRAAITPTYSPSPTTSWTVSVSMSTAATRRADALQLATDTGYDAEGISTELLRRGTHFRVELHRDSSKLLVAFLGSARTRARAVPLPSNVLAAASAGQVCGGGRLELAIDDDLQPNLTASC
jgi:hypothetical protein